MKDYNFFSVYQKKKLTINPKSPSFIIFIAIVIALLGCGGIYFLNYTINQKLTATYTVLNEKRNDPHFAEVKKLENELKALDDYEAMTDKVIAKYQHIDIIKSGFFSDFAKIIPQKIKLTSLNLAGLSFQFQCASPDRKNIAEFLSNMNDSGLFGSVSLLSITAKNSTDTAPTEYSAMIEAILKEGAAE